MRTFARLNSSLTGAKAPLFNEPVQRSYEIKLLFPEIKELLGDKNYPLLKQVLRECNPVGFLDSWRNFTRDEQLEVFNLLPTRLALKLFEILDIDDQQFLLGKVDEESAGPLLEGMASPEIAKILHKMNPRVVKKMKHLIKRQEALSHIDLLMKYPRDSAGSLMHPEFIKLGPKLTAKQALSTLQAIARPNQKEHLFSLFVTDPEGKVLGALDLQTLLGAAEDEKLSELMTSVEPFKVRPEMDQEEVSKLFGRFGLDAAPVVDREERLIGILTLKDILSVERREATEDIAKMVGTRAIDIRETSVLKTVKYRMPWLVVTLFGEILVSLIIKSFEPVLAKVIALASFSPLISAMGGNVGSQSATIVVRSLALGQINTPHQKLRTFLHEAKVGMMLGLSYGILLGIVAYLLYGSRYHWGFSLSVMIGMWTSITVASSMGALEPIFFHRIGIDPATATGPLITTITDIISNLAYYSLATFLLLKLS